MKVAVVGSSGYISGFLLSRLSQISSIESILTIDKESSANAYLDLLHPERFNYDQLCGIDIIIFTAAISSPDKCAQEYELCWAVNVDGTKYFIQKSLELGCKVLFFSSDAVFGDIPGHIYTEISETQATTAYGRMKKAIEDEFKASLLFKAIRLSYVVSMKDRFVSYCLRCASNNEAAEVFHPFYRNCIIVKDVVDVVVWFTQHWSEYEHFVLNVAGTELVSRIRIADELNRHMSSPIKYSISHPDESFYLNRPAFTQMESLYLYKYQILENESFSRKIVKEIEGIIL